MKIAKMLTGLALVAMATVTGVAASAPAPADADPLSVTLVVQDIIPPSTNCTFSANAYGGTGNYTYYWSTNPARIQSAIGNEVTVRSTTNFTVTVRVDDGVSEVAETADITVRPNAPACPS